MERRIPTIDEYINEMYINESTHEYNNIKIVFTQTAKINSDVKKVGPYAYSSHDNLSVDNGEIANVNYIKPYRGKDVYILNFPYMRYTSLLLRKESIDKLFNDGIIKIATESDIVSKLDIKYYRTEGKLPIRTGYTTRDISFTIPENAVIKTQFYQMDKSYGTIKFEVEWYLDEEGIKTFDKINSRNFPSVHGNEYYVSDEILNKSNLKEISENEFNKQKNMFDKLDMSGKYINKSYELITVTKDKNGEYEISKGNGVMPDSVVWYYIYATKQLSPANSKNIKTNDITGFNEIIPELVNSIGVEQKSYTSFTYDDVLYSIDRQNGTIYMEDHRVGYLELYDKNGKSLLKHNHNDRHFGDINLSPEDFNTFKNKIIGYLTNL